MLNCIFVFLNFLKLVILGKKRIEILVTYFHFLLLKFVAQIKK